MNIVDANVLLYAVNTDSNRHAESREWLDEALSGGAVVGFAWIVVLAFLRLATKPGLFPSPLSNDDALSTVDAWLAQPAAMVVEPTARHLSLLRELVTVVRATGNLVNDAHLAALAIEHRGRVVSYDTDFSRFPGVSWSQPNLPPPATSR